jgi:Uma2 family endonuclease
MPIVAKTLPNLESGDRLSREEFHQRYLERADIKKAELVEGVVYLPSPVRANVHGEPNGCMIVWIGTYRARHPELRFGDNATVRLDNRNEVQPDAYLLREVAGGPLIGEDGYIEGPPQLVVEIATSSVSYDLHDKKEAYRRNQVREYLVWRVLDQAIDWFRLEAGEYVRVEPDERGVIESTTFPGLRLNVPNMLAGDLAGVLAELGQHPS